MIGVGVGDEDSIEATDLFSEDLEAELGGGIDDEGGGWGAEEDGGTGPMIFGIGEERGGVVLADDGDPLGGAGA